MWRGNWVGQGRGLIGIWRYRLLVWERRSFWRVDLCRKMCGMRFRKWHRTEWMFRAGWNRRLGKKITRRCGRLLRRRNLRGDEGDYLSWTPRAELTVQISRPFGTGA